MKLIIGVDSPGPSWLVPWVWVSDSWQGVEGHDSTAASDRVVDWSRGFGAVGFDSAVANGTGEPGRAGADVVGIPERPILLRSGSRFGGASSDGAALR